MFTLLDGFPSFTVAVKAQGKVTKEDYENILIPALKKASVKHAGINFIMVMETSLKYFSAAAWISDIKVNLSYFPKWNKIAMVTDDYILENISGIFDVIMPGEVKRFTLNELEAAREWISVP